MTRLLAVAVLSMVAQSVTGASPVDAAEGIVTADQVNGTWRSGKNEFKLLALGKGRLKVAFAGTYEYRTSEGPSANTGETAGIASIEGTTAILKPADFDGCTITLKFVSNPARTKGPATTPRLVVTQDGECGFGLNVAADGTYHRVSSRKPSFSD